MPYIFGSRGRKNAARGQEAGTEMGRLFKAILVLALLGFVALTGYAYLGDYAPEMREISHPVTLDVD